jgi:hypothetical protein
MDNEKLKALLDLNQFKSFDNRNNAEVCGISYYKAFYSDLYKENLMVSLKNNFHNDYWILAIDNDFFEDIAKIRVNTIKDINNIFKIVGIKFTL